MNFLGAEELERYDIRIEESLADSAYRAGIFKPTPEENGGKFHVYVSTFRLEEDKEDYELRVPVTGVPIIAETTGNPPLRIEQRTWEEKPLGEPGVNFPMDKQATYNIAVGDKPSDVVFGLHTRHPDEGPGSTWGHHSFHIHYYWIEPGPVTSETLTEFIRRKSFDQVGINYLAEAALAKRARELGYGGPMSNEFDLLFGGVSYRVQAFVGGIVYCEVGKWQEINHLSW